MQAPAQQRQVVASFDECAHEWESRRAGAADEKNLHASYAAFAELIAASAVAFAALAVMCAVLAVLGSIGARGLIDDMRSIKPSLPALGNALEFTPRIYA